MIKNYNKGCVSLTTVRKRLLCIHRCRGITRRTIHLFLKYDSTLQKIYTLSPNALSQLFLLPKNKAHIFHQDLHNLPFKQQLKIDQSHYKIITIVDESYPDMLKRITDPPLVLYAYGDISLLQHAPKLSVIGTRKPSSEAWKKIYRIVKPLLDQDWLLVSGMAKGIDSFAHLIALNNNRKTIAVLGGGFNHVYPKENIHLFHRIGKSGLVLSEYPPHVPPVRYHFPERNRIISGLSYGTLVIEAMERSGTLITVDQALEQGREVYAVPDSPLIPQTKGCLQMIQDGAKLVINSEDIMEDWKQMYQNFI